MATAPAAVVLEDVTKHFRLRHSRSLKENLVWKAQGRTRHEEFTALGGVNLTITKGETVALLGRN